MVSDTLVGGCVSAGVDGEPPVLDTVYLDHMPAVCELTEER